MHLQHPFWLCTQTVGVHAIGHIGNQLVSQLPLHTLSQKICERPEIVHLFYIGFLWYWYYG